MKWAIAKETPEGSNDFVATGEVFDDGCASWDAWDGSIIQSHLDDLQAADGGIYQATWGAIVAMPLSGTTAFSPSLGELALQAFARIGIGRANITREQIQNAENETNLMFSAWANDGPNLWAVDQLTISLVAGQATYSIDPATVMILDGRISTGTPSVDRVVTQVGRGEYASYPNKAQQSYPTVFWFDRLSFPTVTFWPVPDASQAYLFSYWRAKQQQDAAIAGGLNVDAPYRFLDALVWGLAERLAYIYAPDRVPIVGQRALAAYTAAATQDTEDVPVRFGLGLSSYFR